MTSLAALSTGMRARIVGVVPPFRGGVALWLAVAFWALVVVCALWPSLFAPEDPLTIHYDRVLQAPSFAHLLGTDHYGRDMLGQIVHGTGVSIMVGVVSTVAAVVAGTLVGVVAGYLGGWVDATIMRVIDVLLCFPGILLALVFQAALGPGRVNVMIAVAVAAAPMYARLVRGTTLTQRGRTYVIAARSAGVPEPVVVGRHVLPFLVGPIVSVATIALGTAVVLAASLSFLGLGSDDGVADWGLLIGGGQAYLGSAWWIVTFPGIAIILVVVTAGIIGDALQHRLAEGARS
jgi:peptide/nickel transport system permease protein